MPGTEAQIGPWTKTRSEIALALREDPHADVADLRRRLKVEHMAASIRDTLATLPPLCDDERAALAALLGGDGGAS